MIIMYFLTVDSLIDINNISGLINITLRKKLMLNNTDMRKCI